MQRYFGKQSSPKEIKEVEDFYQYNSKNKMGIDVTKLKSALVSALITAFLAGAGYVIGINDVFSINIHALVNVVVLSALTAVVSLIKSGLTTDEGKFAGAVMVK